VVNAPRPEVADHRPIAATLLRSARARQRRRTRRPGRTALTPQDHRSYRPTPLKPIMEVGRGTPARSVMEVG
jgi:hypothetical protein